MVFGLSGGGENGEHIGVGFVELSKIVVMQDAFLFRTKSYARI